jgi:hypothetical protein
MSAKAMSALRGSIAVGAANERDGPPVIQQPSMQVRSWRLLRAPSGTLHLVALEDLSAGGDTVRVTSAIAAFDSDSSVATTASGQRYALIGPPEDGESEREVLLSGAVRLGRGDAVDVSVLAWNEVHIG